MSKEIDELIKELNRLEKLDPHGIDLIIRSIMNNIKQQIYKKSKNASKELKFASTKQAFQHLADITGKRIKIAIDIENEIIVDLQRNGSYISDNGEEIDEINEADIEVLLPTGYTLDEDANLYDPNGSKVNINMLDVLAKKVGGADNIFEAKNEAVEKEMKLDYPMIKKKDDGHYIVSVQFELIS